MLDNVYMYMYHHLDMLKEILVKDFNKFMDRPVSSVLAWSRMFEYLSLLYDRVDVLWVSSLSLSLSLSLSFSLSPSLSPLSLWPLPPRIVLTISSSPKGIECARASLLSW